MNQARFLDAQGSRGFTLLEALVALTLLITGSALAWWTLRLHEKSEAHLRETWAAMEVVQNESEAFLAKPTLPWDTAFPVRSGRYTFEIRRRSIDSAAFIEAASQALTLGEAERRFRLRPREFVLEAWKKAEAESPPFETPVADSAKPLAKLHFQMPLDPRP